MNKEEEEEEEKEKNIRPIFYGDLKHNNQNALTPKNVWEYLSIFFNNKLYTDQCPTSLTDTLPIQYEWDNFNYCNPPFNKTGRFIQKAKQEQLKKKVIILLCPANFHQIYMQKLFVNVKKKHKINFVIINSKLTFDRLKKDGTQEQYKQPLSNLLCFIIFGKIPERRIFKKKENKNLKQVSKHYNYFEIFNFEKHSNYVSGFKYEYKYKHDYNIIINNYNLSKQFLVLLENTLNICKINVEKEKIENNFKYFKEMEKKKEKNQKVQYNYQYNKKNNISKKKNGKRIPSYIKISTESFFVEAFNILGHYFNIKDFFQNYLFSNNPFEEEEEEKQQQEQEQEQQQKEEAGEKKNKQSRKTFFVQEMIIKVEQNKKYINYNLFLPYILESFLLKSNEYYTLNEEDIKLKDYITENSLQNNCYYNIFEFVENYKDLLFSKWIFNLIIKKKFYRDILLCIDKEKIKQNQIYKGKIDLILLFDTLTRYYYHMMLKKNKGKEHMEFSCGLNLHFLENIFKDFNTTEN